MTTRARTLAVVIGSLFLAAPAARAAQYPGWGDTAWVYSSKRDCCSAAIEVAASYSAEARVTSGGVPRPFRGSTERGTCRAEWQQDGNGGVMYRCSGEAYVWCR